MCGIYAYKIILGTSLAHRLQWYTALLGQRRIASVKDATAAPGSPPRRCSRPASLALLAADQHNSELAQGQAGRGRGVR